MIIWRCVLAGHVTVEQCKNGAIDIIDILKLNSLLDLKEALEAREMAKMRNK